MCLYTEAQDSVERRELSLVLDETRVVHLLNTAFLHFVRKLHPCDKWDL